MNLVAKAFLFAQKAHSAQRRRYTNKPYFNHPLQVACIVSKVTEDAEILAAALLHDVIEDTAIRPEQIEAEFTPRVSRLVKDLTDTSTLDGNRRTRKEIDRRRIAQADPDAKTIKLADRIDNLPSIIYYDPDFATVYLAETQDLLPALKGGDYGLWIQLRKIVDQFHL
jgi:(p)ppGpp synthase/HD superfamily hydrolase